MTSPRYHRLALALNPALGAKRLAHIESRINDLRRITHYKQQDLCALGFELSTIKHILNPDYRSADEALHWQEQDGCHLLLWDDKEYPQLLREIKHPPPVLFVKGNVAALKQTQLAMVGSRNPSYSGRETAYDFAYALAEAGITITSGMAIGIDTASHQGALAAGGTTLAVLGSGVNVIYPRCNKALSEKIVEHGALISEFPLREKPKAQYFPQRNRIISGLSHGVLITEATLRSGSLITANFALEQNRDVFAIPGSIHNPLSKGCHHLIKQGATLVEKLDDLMDEMNPSWRQQSLAKETHCQLADDYQKLVKCIDYESTSVELIINRSKISPQMVLSMLTELEVAGQITATPGGYTRIP